MPGSDPRVNHPGGVPRIHSSGQHGPALTERQLPHPNRGGLPQRDQHAAQRGQPPGRSWPPPPACRARTRGRPAGPGGRSRAGSRRSPRRGRRTRRSRRPGSRARARTTARPACRPPSRPVGGQRQRERATVVCRPLPTAADHARPRRSASGTSALTSVDLPTPECPTSADTRPASASASAPTRARRGGSPAPAAPARRSARRTGRGRRGRPSSGRAAATGRPRRRRRGSGRRTRCAASGRPAR